MRNRFAVNMVLVLISVIAVGFCFGWNGVAAAKTEEPAGLAQNTAETPREPQGAPESQFVQDMQALFSSGGSSAAPGASSSPLSSIAGISKLAVKGITPAPEPVYVWTDKVTYRIGEYARVFFRIPRPAYVYIIDIDASGRISLVFPNSSDRNSYIDRAGTQVLPRGNYTFPVTGPTGREHLMLVASSEPVGYFDRVAARGGDFTAVDNAGQVLRFVGDWVHGTSAWSSFAWNSFTISSNTPSYGPRNQQPVVRLQASATRVSAGTMVTFTSRGTNDPDGSIRSYSWDLNGDGRTDATGDTAKWTYNSAGVYNVRLTVEDNRGATESATIQIVVEARKTLLQVDADAKSRAIYLDGSYVGASSTRQYVSPGTHSIKVVGPDNQTYNTTVDIAPGMRSVKIEVDFE